MVSDLNRKINAVSPRSQLLYGALLTAFLVICYIFFVNDTVLENTSHVNEKWSKLGILLTMFGTIFTLFKAIVLFGYKDAAIALLKVEQELSNKLFIANETSDHEKASHLKEQVVKLEKQKAELQSKPDVDIYDKWAIFFSIVLLEVGLALQLFAV